MPRSSPGRHRGSVVLPISCGIVDAPPSPARRLVVLVSGAGSNLQALLDASTDPAYGAQVVAVGADRDGTAALERAERAGVPTFVVRTSDFADRDGLGRRADRPRSARTSPTWSSRPGS